MTGCLRRAKHDTLSELRMIRHQLPDIKGDLASLAANSTVVGVGLRDLQVMRPP